MADHELIGAVEDRCKRLATGEDVSLHAVADALGYIGLLAVSNARRAGFGWPACAAVVATVGMLIGLAFKFLG